MPLDAIRYGQEALERFERFSDPGAQVKTLNEMAWAHMALGAYDRAIEHAERGLALAEASTDLAGTSRASNNLGVIYDNLRDAENAPRSGSCSTAGRPRRRSWPPQLDVR